MMNDRIRSSQPREKPATRPMTTPMTVETTVAAKRDDQRGAQAVEQVREVVRPGRRRDAERVVPGEGVERRADRRVAVELQDLARRAARRGR